MGKKRERKHKKIIYNPLMPIGPSFSLTPPSPLLSATQIFVWQLFLCPAAAGRGGEGRRIRGGDPQSRCRQTDAAIEITTQLPHSSPHETPKKGFVVLSLLLLMGADFSSFLGEGGLTEIQARQTDMHALRLWTREVLHFLLSLCRPSSHPTTRQV